MSERLYIILNQTMYEWHGSYGGVLCSREYRRKTGDVRYIKGSLFYADKVRTCGNWWTKPQVFWMPIHEITPEWLRDFKRELFGVKESQ